MAITEAQTRAELIDAQLGASGRNVKDPTQVIEEFDIPTSLPDGVAETRTKYEGHQFSDYVLLGKDRKPLAVVEAKKSSRDAAIAGKIESLSSRYQQRLADLEALYGALSQQAFKGELDLSRAPFPPTKVCSHEIHEMEQA